MSAISFSNYAYHGEIWKVVYPILPLNQTKNSMEIVPNRFYIWNGYLRCNLVFVAFSCDKTYNRLIGGREMITHIRMQNFKSWKDSGTVKLAPLTGFFGTNSSGKSSLLQMLLCSNRPLERMKFSSLATKNSLVNLGSFREVIHRHKSKEHLGFEFACKFTHPYSYFKIPEDGSPWEQIIDQFAIDSTIRAETGELVVDRLLYGYSHGRSAEIVCEGGNASFPREYGNQTKLKLDNCYGIYHREQLKPKSF